MTLDFTFSIHIYAISRENCTKIPLLSAPTLYDCPRWGTRLAWKTTHSSGYVLYYV